MAGAVDREADGIAADLPDAQPGAVEESERQRRADSAASEKRPPRDREKRTFDPALHQANPDGSPKLSSKGRLMGIPGRQLPRSRASAAGMPAPSRSEVPGAGPSPGPEPSSGGPGAEHVRTAALLVDSVTSLLAMWLGESWKPKTSKIGATKIDERAELIRVWAVEFERRGVSEVDPRLELAIVMGGYVAPRLAEPGTVSKFREGWQSFTAWSGRQWRKATGRGTHADRGHDRERKDDARPETRPPD